MELTTSNSLATDWRSVPAVFDHIAVFDLALPRARSLSRTVAAGGTGGAGVGGRAPAGGGGALGGSLEPLVTGARGVGTGAESRTSLWIFIKFD